MKRLLSAVQATTITLLLTSSCSDFLNVKSSKSFIHAESAQDLQMMLDQFSDVNMGTSAILEAGTDDYVVQDTRFSILTLSEQEIYIWKPEIYYEGLSLGGWRKIFQTFYFLNSVLEEMRYVDDMDARTKVTIEGSVLFWRSLYHFQGAEVFCLPYVNGTENDGLGFPMKYEVDFFEKVERGTIKGTYDRILAEMHRALELLPVESVYKSRPTKAAAHAALARIYLAMQIYDQAAFHADEALKIQSTLLDFNVMDLSSNIPIPQHNDQVILLALGSSGPTGLLHANRNAYVPQELYDQYEDGDLRKIGYFYNRGNGMYSFKARHAVSLASQFFSGFATDELYLIRAECSARSGEVEAALSALNYLLRHRWDPDKFTPITASSAEEALQKVLIERRKELLMRGVRWSDLRRLNLDPRFAKTITRTLTLDGETKEYSLPPGDLRYAFPIPKQDVDALGIQQNLR